jgi:serine/threonine protein kinase
MDNSLLTPGDSATPIESGSAAPPTPETIVESAVPRTDALAMVRPYCDAAGRLGHYRLLELVGRGGFGLVFAAEDEKLQRVVAIKVLMPLLATAADARQRFLREARLAASVTHDHIVAIHAVEEFNGLPAIVMPFIVGVSLHERLLRGGPLAAEEIEQIGAQTAAGLAAAHERGLIHRDIKPANILLESATGRVKITDFGLARAVDDVAGSQHGLILGTPGFMAPEQARGDQVDHRADLFSLGCVLYALCVGRAPSRCLSHARLLRRDSD